MQYCDEREIVFIQPQEQPDGDNPGISSRTKMPKGKKENEKKKIEKSQKINLVIDTNMLNSIIRDAIIMMQRDPMLDHLYEQKIKLLQQSLPNLDFLIPKLQKTIEKFGKGSVAVARETMWREFHSIGSDQELIKSLQSSLEGPLGFESWFLLYIQTSLHKQLGIPLDEESVPQIKISDDEKDVIAYVGGAILSKLEKRFFKLLKTSTPEKMSSIDKDLLIIDSFKAEDGEEKSNEKLISALNRGGLTQAKSGFCAILLVAENIFQTHVSKIEKTINATYILEDCLQNSEIERKFLNLIPQQCSFEDALFVRKAVLSLYIKIRCHSYANNTIDKYRKEADKSSKQKGIRTELKTKKDNDRD